MTHIANRRESRNSLGINRHIKIAIATRSGINNADRAIEANTWGETARSGIDSPSGKGVDAPHPTTIASRLGVGRRTGGLAQTRTATYCNRRAVAIDADGFGGRAAAGGFGHHHGIASIG